MDIEGFYAYLLNEGKHPTTVGNYVTAIKTLQREYTVFSQKHTQLFLNKKVREISASGYNKYIKAIKCYCAFRGIRPYDFVKKHREKAKERILLTDKEALALVNIVYRKSIKYSIFWGILLYTGARPGEIAQLRAEHIDVSAGVIYCHQTKTEARKIPITQPLAEILYPYLSTLTTDLLFPNNHSSTTCITYASYMKDWKRRLRDLGIKKKVAPYSLRHSFLTGTLGNGANLLDIQDVVGHSDANITKRYYHKNIERMRTAAERLPLAQSHIDPQAQFLHLVENIHQLHLDTHIFEITISNSKIIVEMKPEELFR